MSKMRLLSVVLPVLFYTPVSGLQHEEAGRMYERGKYLLQEVHCGDCYTRTEEGVLEGISLVEQALQAGFEDRKSAYLLLEQAYMTMTGIVGGDTKAWNQKRNRIVAVLLQLFAEDPEVVDRFAEQFVESDAERLRLYAKALEIEPERATLRFQYGTLVLKKGEWRTGFDQIGRAVESVQDFAVLRTFLANFIDLLRQPEVYLLPFRCQGTERVQMLEGEIEKIWSLSHRAGYSRTIPTAVQEFKARFKKELSHLDCTTVFQ